MIDIKLLREQPDLVRDAMKKLGAEDAPVEEAIRLDQRRRQILTELEALKAERNKGSKAIGQLMREGKRCCITFACDSRGQLKVQPLITGYVDHHHDLSTEMHESKVMLGNPGDFGWHRRELD